MKRLIFLWVLAIGLGCSVQAQNQNQQTKTKQELKAERKAHRQAIRAHNRMVRQLQNQIAYNNALQALKSKSWVLQANTLFNNYGMAIPVTNNTNFVAMDNNHVSVQVAFNGFNPGPNGLGGVTLTGWPNGIHLRVDKNGNATYTFNAMGAALFAQITVQMSYGSNYATATVDSNTNNRQLTFSGNLVPYNQSNIFQSGFSF